MSFRIFFIKTNVTIMAITIVTLLSGIAIFASEIMNTAKEHKVDLHTSAVVNIAEQMTFLDVYDTLGENPTLQGTLQVHVKGVPEESIHDYKLHTVVKVCADKRCEKEIQQGFKADVIDENIE